MEVAKPSSLYTLPTEMIQHIYGFLDTKSFKALRLTCNHLANCGYWPLQGRVGAIVDNSMSGSIDGATLVRKLVVDLQGRIPNAAAKVIALEIELAYRPYNALPPSLGAVNLPSLQILNLTGVAVTKSSLRTMLKKHKRTLKEINFCDVALSLRNPDDMDYEEKLEPWIHLVKYLQKLPVLEEVSLGPLTWYNNKHERPDRDTVMTSNAKYHKRFFDSECEEYFSLSNYGMSAVGIRGTSEGLEAFIEEVKKPRRRLPKWQVRDQESDLHLQKV